MDLKWKVPIFALILLLCGSVDCRRQKQFSQHEMVKDDPFCEYQSINNEIYCNYLQSTDMDLLKQSLQETSQFVTSFGVDLVNCDGPSIPVDVFSGYNLSLLVLDNCGFTEIPYEILSNIQAPMQQLYMWSDTFSSTETTATELFLPFSVFELTSLNIYDVNLDSIGLELLQLYNLDYINFRGNNISAIETGAFRDLKKLVYLYLDLNNLSELQEGAFMGLETSPIYVIALNGNPFKCDCNLQWLKDWLNARDLTESSGARCAYPTDVAFNDIEFCPTGAHT